MNKSKNIQQDDNDSKIQRSVQQIEKIQNKHYNLEKKISILALFCFFILIVYIFIHTYAGKQVQPYIPEKYKQMNYDTLVTKQQLQDTPSDEPEEPIVSANDIDYKDSLVFWGDAFATNHNDNPGYYTNVLLNLVSNDSYNITGMYYAGVYEDTFKMTLARQGGAPMLVNPFTIPANSTPVPITLVSSLGEDLTPTTVNKGGINPCTISDVEGTLSYSDGKLYFARNNSGDSVTINEPSVVTTSAMQNVYDCTQILFIGNMSQNYDVNTLISMYQKFADNVDTGRYLIIGSLNGNSESNQALENAMSQTFGEHYLNLREYLITQVFEDYSIALNFSDIQSIKSGIIPPVFLSDSNTFTDMGNEIVGNVIFKKLLELNYLQK